MAEDNSQVSQKELKPGEGIHSGKNETPKSEDPELDDLLDSALEDFEKAASTEPVAAAHLKPATTAKQKTETSAGNQSEEARQEALFNDIFDAGFSEEASKAFENEMRGWMGGDPEVLRQFDTLTQAADRVGDSEESQRQFAETLQQTLGSLAQNTEELQTDVSDEDLVNMMTSLGMDGDAAGGEFLPAMQTMMKSLLSKDILYPSLKEISTRYPAWLSENQSKVKESEYVNYQKQYEIMGQICEEFESETDSDSEQVKTTRFERIMELMQTMQQYGQPPKEIVGQVAPGLQLDANGMPRLPGSPENCEIM